MTVNISPFFRKRETCGRTKLKQRGAFRLCRCAMICARLLCLPSPSAISKRRTWKTCLAILSRASELKQPNVELLTSLHTRVETRVFSARVLSPRLEGALRTKNREENYCFSGIVVTDITVSSPTSSNGGLFVTVLKSFLFPFLSVSFYITPF